MNAYRSMMDFINILLSLRKKKEVIPLKTDPKN